MCVCVYVCLEGKERRRRQKRRIRRKKMQRKRGGKERGGEGRQGKKKIKKKKKNKKCRQAPGPQAYILKCFQLWNILSLYNHTGCAFLMPKYQFHQSKYISSVQFSSVAQSCLTLCDPMDCSTPDLPVHHQLPEFTQTHVH